MTKHNRCAGLDRDTRGMHDVGAGHGYSLRGSTPGKRTVCSIRADGQAFGGAIVSRCAIDRAAGQRGGGGVANAGRRRRWRRRLRHPRSGAAEQATALAGLDTVADRMTSASSRSTPAGAPAPT